MMIPLNVGRGGRRCLFAMNVTSQSAAVRSGTPPPPTRSLVTASPYGSWTPRALGCGSNGLVGAYGSESTLLIGDHSSMRLSSKAKGTALLVDPKPARLSAAAVLLPYRQRLQQLRADGLVRTNDPTASAKTNGLGPLSAAAASSPGRRSLTPRRDDGTAILALLPRATADHFSPRRYEAKRDAAEQTEAGIRGGLECDEEVTFAELLTAAASDRAARREWSRQLTTRVASLGQQLDGAEYDGRARIARLHLHALPQLAADRDRCELRVRSQEWLRDHGAIRFGLLADHRDTAGSIDASITVTPAAPESTCLHVDLSSSSTHSVSGNTVVRDASPRAVAREVVQLVGRGGTAAKAIGQRMSSTEHALALAIANNAVAAYVWTIVHQTLGGDGIDSGDQFTEPPGL
jgi:hypothetical protein